MQPIRLRGARLHNLKDVGVDLRPGELVVVVGVSGSGKSSLAFDTLYAEGQRRFVESFSPYARQFLERLERPPMDSLEPVAAGVAVDRRAPIKSSRSTVATMADLEPYLSALFTRESAPTCPDCGLIAARVEPARFAATTVREHAGARCIVAYPTRVEGVERYLELRESLLADGYRRVLVGGVARELDELRPSDALAESSQRLEVVVDRLALGEQQLERLAEAVESAWRRGEERAVVSIERSGGGPAVRLEAARGLACPGCGRGFSPPAPGLFSYQSPVGACPACRGFGRVLGVDYGKVFPDESLSLAEGAVRPWRGKKTAWERRVLRKFCEREGIAHDAPWRELGEEARRRIVDGDGKWRGESYPGVALWFKWLESKSYKMHVRVLLSRYRSYDPCAACGTKRLGPESLSYRLGGLDLGDWHALELSSLHARLAALALGDGQGKLARDELASRIGYLEKVGLGYLTLDRQARTLSGGEAQRVSLTAALGSSLTGALFVLDEPTVGLHPGDLAPLVVAMRELAERGNVVVVVEHDPRVIEAADRVLELGPGAGADGGRLVFDGSPEAARKHAGATAQALAPVVRVEGLRDVAERDVAERDVADRELPERGELTIVGARANNLRELTVSLPLGALVVVCGPSGSGKSTLVNGILYRALARARGDGDVEAPGAHEEIVGGEAVRDVVLVDQAPLGRTSRGNAATYTGAWDRIRTLFAREPAAALTGLTASHFSFNVAAGRCEACAGEGAETVEMQFLADVRLTCPACGGKRFRAEVLAVALDGRSIADVLAMSVAETLAWLGAREARLRRALGPVVELGLGYLPLGQPLSTLSGGEAQRLKLARALASAEAGTLLVLDEPSAGLHASEVTRLNGTLRGLVLRGASVVVVEHDPAVIAAADRVLELGPGAGAEGGRLVFAGSPAELAVASTRTGLALARARAGDASRTAKHAAEGSADAPRTVRLAGKSSATPRAARPAGAHEPLAGAHEPAPDEPPAIEVRGAREHNLANVDVHIPHGRLTVVTGPSGSGKSSLAFDVVFAEGQRRFLETLTPYARQFLPMMPRPDVDSISMVPPSIALEQRTARAGATSTVATVTEVAHYLRLLFAKVGTPHCPDCDELVDPAAPDDVFARLTRVRGTHALLAPVVRGRKGTHLEVFASAERIGVSHALADGKLVATRRPPKLARTKEHTVELVVHEGSMAKLPRDAFDRALSLSRGQLVLAHAPAGSEGPRRLFSTARACGACGTAIPELDPRWFSFNTAEGRCAECGGTGTAGGEDALAAREAEAGDDEAAPLVPCEACQGSRLAPIPRAVRFAGRRYHEYLALDADELHVAAAALAFEGNRARIAEAPLAELRRRLAFVVSVGLGYLGLDRRAQTLSGGELQRLRLAAQLGSGLTGALYVLDEPTIGLHPRDTARLLESLRGLRDTGSTVLVIEHDAETIRAADHLIDLGPTGGHRGGRVMAEGAPDVVLRDPASPTGRALADEAALIGAREKLGPATAALLLTDVRANNLRIERLRIPAARLCVVAGVSGSGKSTLVNDVVFRAVRRALAAGPKQGRTKRLTRESFSGPGLELPSGLERVLHVDQAPIGRTSRSVPATFLGLWDTIRKLFALTPDARARGFGPARFAFNSAAAGGRCQSCDGLGTIAHEMSFLPDVTTVCAACTGLRYEPSTLGVRYLGLTIGEVLRLSAEEAARLFAAHPSIAGPLTTLTELGVGYVELGQGSPTLSGGEAQRLKLAAELSLAGRHRPTLYVLDEPTTGLHHSDVRRLVTVLDRLVRRGDTLLVIEHHPAMIAAADWVIELGPEGGKTGGRVIAEGTPAELAALETPTGRVLAALLARDRGRDKSRRAAKAAR